MERTIPKFERSHRMWMEKCVLLIQSSRKCGPVEIEELPQKRRGRPLLLGEELEDELKSFIEVACGKGTIVNTHSVMATARGVVISHDANLFLENGGSSKAGHNNC